MYSNGEGVPKNNVAAYALFSIVAAQGSSEAEKNKIIVAQRLTRAQIAAGQKLSKELWEKYVVPFQKK
jgi:TPR repeat protein